MNEALRQLEALLSNAAAQAPRFAANSRYNGVPTLSLTMPDGRVVAYVARRFVVDPGATSQWTVVQGDRLDLIATRLLGDPLQWWKQADANLGLKPDELTDVPGRRLRVVAPDGFPGANPLAAQA